MASCPSVTTKQSSNNIARNNTWNYFSLPHHWEWWIETQSITEQGGLEVFGIAWCLSVMSTPVFPTSSTVLQQCCALNRTANYVSVSWLSWGLNRSERSKLKAWKRDIQQSARNIIESTYLKFCLLCKPGSVKASPSRVPYQVEIWRVKLLVIMHLSWAFI